MWLLHNTANNDFYDQTTLDEAITSISGLQGQMESILKPIIAMIDETGDEAAALGMLAEAYPGIDDAGLVEKLYQMIFAAKVWGRLSAEAELKDG